MRIRNLKPNGGTVAVGALALCLLWSAPALAEDAEALLQKGIVQFRMGMFEESVQTFEKAARATREPGLRGRIQLKLGVSHGVLKQERKAAAAFRAALAHDPSLTLTAGKVKGSVLALFERIRAGIKGELKVTADGAGARVRVDGKDVGPAPFLGKLPVGQHRVEVVSADGKRGFSTDVLVRADVRRTVGARLVRYFGALHVTSTPPGARVLREGKLLGTTPYEDPKVPVGEHPLVLQLDGHRDHRQTVRVKRGEAAAVTAALVPVTVAGPKRRFPVWTVVTAGAALAVAGVGIGMGVSATSAWDEYQQTKNGHRHDELRDTISTRATVANVSFATAGALAITAAAIYLFVESRRERPKASAALGVGPGAVSVGFEF